MLSVWNISTNTKPKSFKSIMDEDETTEFVISMFDYNNPISNQDKSDLENQIITLPPNSLNNNINIDIDIDEDEEFYINDDYYESDVITFFDFDYLLYNDEDYEMIDGQLIYR